jgi:hypothetical protein
LRFYAYSERHKAVGSLALICLRVAAGVSTRLTGCQDVIGPFPQSFWISRAKVEE